MYEMELCFDQLCCRTINSENLMKKLAKNKKYKKIWKVKIKGELYERR